MKNLICWQENLTKKWEMIEDPRRDEFIMQLLIDDNVDNHTIFIIPVNSILGAIWIWTKTHTSNRVDFNNFYEEYRGKRKKLITNKKPDIKCSSDKIIDNKYGWISPNGKYFKCNFHGHVDLANKICFGLVETDNPELYLETHGWCKIFKPLSEEQYAVYVDDSHVITDAQIKTLLNMGLDNAKNLVNMLTKNNRM